MIMMVAVARLGTGAAPLPVCIFSAQVQDVNGGKYYISAEGELFVSHFAND